MSPLRRSESAVDHARPRRPRLRAKPRAWLVAACAALFVALRCLVAIGADPPRKVLGREARELYAEPPAKSHEARNYALFGAFRLSPVDDYQFWRAQSPLWVYPLTLFFTLFGVDYPQLRSFSTLYAASGLIWLLLIASERLRSPVWLGVGLALALDPLYFHTARVGFLEPAVASWVALSVLALLRAEADARWLCLALLAFAAAFLTKQAALYALPLLAIACIYRLRRLSLSAPAERRAFRLVIGCGLGLLALCALYIASSDYTRAVVHNVNHVLLGSDAPSRNQYRDLSSLLFRLRDRERFTHFFASLAITGPLALASCLGFALHAARSRRLPSYADLVLLGWFLCALLGMAALAKSALRFWTVVVPPAALLAAVGIERTREALAARGHGRLLRALPIALPALALLLWSVRGHLTYLSNAQYSMQEAAQVLRRELGDQPATIVGFPSPGIVLGTPYRNFYVRSHFNSSRSQLAQLGITHFLFRQFKDGTRDIIEAEFPELLPSLRPARRLTVRGERLALFRLEHPLDTPASVSARGGSR